jgi:putative transposase
MDAMSASLVYLLLRQVLQMLTQLARDGGAKDVELLWGAISQASP